jgi:predicted metalloprotease
MQANHFARLARIAILIFLPATTYQTQAGAQGLLESLNLKDRMMRAGVSADDLAKVREKLAMAQPFFVQVWNYHAWNGTSSPLRSEPVFHPYVLEFKDANCGDITVDNAFYCPAGNTIFYDEIFLARQMKQASKAVGTDGDYAAIVILAHELGHAISYRTMRAADKLEREAMADCVAGAVSKMAENRGHLEAGDLKEARAELASGGTRDPDELSPVISSMIISSGHWDNHGSATTRLRNFDMGYKGGLDACPKASPSPMPQLTLPHN